MPEATMKVELISTTPDGEMLSALAARLCYSAANLNALRERVSTQDQSKLISSIMDSGHHSVFEHVSFTFAIEGVSRVLLAQLTRHRIASFSVQSQRYVSMAQGFEYVIPPRIKALGLDAVNEYKRQMAQMHQWYQHWQQLLGKGESSNEDARFVLPGACETRLILTMNARELMHFFRLRCCQRAQWEIRELATRMLSLCKQHTPLLFTNAGPGCVAGSCPEGSKTCGRAAEVRAKFHQI